MHLKCGHKRVVIEVKSLADRNELERSMQQSAGYAKKLSMGSIVLAVFMPVEDEKVLKELSGETVVDGVYVFVSAIGWV